MRTRLLSQPAIWLRWAASKLHPSWSNGCVHWVLNVICFDGVRRVCPLDHELYQIFSWWNVRIMRKWLLCYQLRRMRDAIAKLPFGWHGRPVSQMRIRLHPFGRKLLRNYSKLYDHQRKRYLLIMHGRLLPHFIKNVHRTPSKLHCRQSWRKMHTMWGRIRCFKWRMHNSTGLKLKLRWTRLNRKMHFMQKLLWTRQWRLRPHRIKSFL